MAVVVQESVHAGDDVRAVGLAYGHRSNLPFKPLDALVIPVAHQRSRADDEGPLGDGPVAGDALLEQGPEERDTLEGLTEAHVVGEDAPVTVEPSETHDALEHELDSLPLVRPEKLDEHVVDGDRRELLPFRVESLPQHQRLDARRELFGDILRGLRNTEAEADGAGDAEGAAGVRDVGG